MGELRRLSASQIKLYQECAKLYHSKYKDKRISAQNNSAILGTALHKAIEMYFKDGSNPRVTFETTFDKLIKEAQETGEGLKIYGSVASSKKTGFEILGKIEWPKLTPLLTTDLEIRFELPFPNKENPICIIVGVIDDITEDEYVVDHKSGSKLPNPDELANDVQFMLYYWAFKEIKGYAPKGVIWHHLRTGTFHNTEIENNYPRKFRKLVKDVKQLLNEKEYKKKESPDGFCKNVCELYTECWGNK